MTEIVKAQWFNLTLSLLGWVLGLVFVIGDWAWGAFLSGIVFGAYAVMAFWSDLGRRWMRNSDQWRQIAETYQARYEDARQREEILMQAINLPAQELGLIGQSLPSKPPTTH